ncbi:hypothetical protein EUGRSUZ_I00624 [Eucalyptus grandis]|uniref:Uncharacterized protein n=2 Tax=Eucalyptus grandis TaxID=71139 RepID=A0ACC3JFE9_EUCGR|nr:hypothetical protein EUGRSUZ_I00624 [Eucalyptus grandis]
MHFSIAIHHTLFTLQKKKTSNMKIICTSLKNFLKCSPKCNPSTTIETIDSLFSFTVCNSVSITIII